MLHKKISHQGGDEKNAICYKSMTPEQFVADWLIWKPKPTHQSASEKKCDKDWLVQSFPATANRCCFCSLLVGQFLSLSSSLPLCLVLDPWLTLSSQKNKKKTQQYCRGAWTWSMAKGIIEVVLLWVMLLLSAGSGGFVRELNKLCLPVKAKENVPL